jgi:hypothetical protein
MAKLIALVLGPGGAPGFRRRLEDNAYVLLRTGSARDGRRALVAALALDPPDLATAGAHPLVRALAAHALDTARAQLGQQTEATSDLARLAQLAGLAGAPQIADETSPAIALAPEEPRLTTTPSGLILPR